MLAHEREHLAEKAEKSEDRTLVLYIRQGHGHMDAFKFSLMAKFIYEYVTSGRSPIFNKVKIVSYHAGDYPKMIHDLGIPESTYNSERGFDFERNAIGGNMVLFSHANATTQQNLGSIPIIGLGALRNTDKYNKEKYFVPLRSFHDKNDNAVNFPKLDDGFWKKYKDRGRDLDRMLLAFAASVFALENKMLNQINQAD